MKSFKGIYHILSYVFFILPPFIWGLVVLYLERAWEVHIVSLVVNVIVYALIAIVMGLLVFYKKFHIPDKTEQKQLLFGFIGNVVVYFYTFQNNMNLQDLVTIYLILLIVLIVRYYLLNRSIQNRELWILLPIFLFIDTMHMLFTGCGFTNSGTMCNVNSAPDWSLYILYAMVAIVTIGYYGYKIYLYKRWNFFGLLNLTLVLLMSLLIQEGFNTDEKILGTLAIAIAFFVILDFIVSIVNKTYSHRILLYYIRTTTLLVLFMLLSEERFFTGEATRNMLILMVMVTYVSFGITILKSLLHIKEEATVDVLKGMRIQECTELHRNDIKKAYGNVAYDHMELGDNHYSLVAVQDGSIIGFISTYVKSFPAPHEELHEAYINIIEVHPNHRLKGVASTLLQDTEKHFSKQGIKQIRAWSSNDKTEALHMWVALHYNLCPTTIHIPDKNVNVEGYYVIKSL